MSAPTLARPATGALLPPESQPYVRRRGVRVEADEFGNGYNVGWMDKPRIGRPCGWDCARRFGGHDVSTALTPPGLRLPLIDGCMYDHDGFMICGRCFRVFGSPVCCNVHLAEARESFLIQMRYLSERKPADVLAGAR